MSDAADGKAPVRASVTTAWRFFFAHWAEFTPAAAVVAVAAGLGDLLQASAPAGGMIIKFVLSTVAGAVFFAVVLRRAVRNEATGPFGLSFGADEVRLIGVSLSLLLMIAPIVILVALVLFVTVLGRVAGTPQEMQALLADSERFSRVVAERLGPTGELAFSLFVLLVCAVVVWLLVRLVLINAATIGERRVVIFQSWSWTHGNFLRVLAAIVLTSLPAVIVTYFLSALLITIMGGAAPGSPIGVFLLGGFSGFVGAMSEIPALALAAHLYKGLRPPDFVPK
jgi:hypothetical protein